MFLLLVDSCLFKNTIALLNGRVQSAYIACISLGCLCGYQIDARIFLQRLQCYLFQFRCYVSMSLDFILRVNLLLVHSFSVRLPGSLAFVDKFADGSLLYFYSLFSFCLLTLLEFHVLYRLHLQV